jgi:hypothetical protein
MHRISVVAAVALALLLNAAAAEAGTYHVYTCSAAGKVWPNNAWSTAARAPVAVDNSCAGNVISLRVATTTQMADNTSAALVFTSPAGTTIGDFALTRQLDYVNAAPSGTHQYFVTYALGSTVFAGAGDYADATRNALNKQKQWYGYPAGTAHVARGTVTRASFPALATYNGTANQLVLRAGCYKRGTPCGLTSGNGITHALYGSDITVNDPTPPDVTVEASGLLAGGVRSGSDPVTLSASDSAGIRRVDLIDVGSQTVVGSEDYTTGRTESNRLCDFSLPAPCPQLSGETVRPTSLSAGNHQLVVRVTDTGGNVTDRGPYPLFNRTPSDRGAPNGTNVTDAATMNVAFTNTKKPRQTAKFGKHVKIRGKLVNAARVPIGNARVELLTRDLRRDAKVVLRQMLTTRADGSFSTTVAASASRLIQLAWHAYANDASYSANGYLTLRARASASLKVSTHRPRVGRRMTVSGRIHGVSRKGVVVILQGKPRGAKRYTTFADTTASSHGLFKVHYRFRDSGSRGRRFQFRARIRPVEGFPYELGYSGTETVRVR